MLVGASRAFLAWEWLRRDPIYRQSAAASTLRHGRRIVEEQPGALPWGLHVFEDPSCGIPSARPIWRRQRLQFVLRAVVGPATETADEFPLSALARLVTLAVGTGEHLLLSNGRQGIRLDLRGRSILAPPVTFRYRLAGFRSARAPLIVLERLMHVLRDGSMPLLPDRLKASARHVRVLRAWDAIAAGATQREIAEALLARGADLSGWRVDQPSLRSQAQRLVRTAREMAAGGFWRLLQ